MPTTSTTPKTWPTGDAFTRALARVGEAGETIEILTRELTQLVDLDACPSVIEDAEPPSLAMLGSLTKFVTLLECDYEFLGDHLRTLRSVRDALADENFEEAGDDAR